MSLRPVVMLKAQIWVHPHQRGGAPVAGHFREVTAGQSHPIHDPRAGGAVRIIGQADNGEAIVQHEHGPRVQMPAASVQHYVNDLNGYLPHPPTSGIPAVDHVLRGNGEHIGKGNDGIVYRSGDSAVKVSTTVPYQPHNRGHRTPEQAVAHSRGEHEAHRALADLAHVPPVEGTEHDGRYWLVKPWAPEVTADAHLSRGELDSVAGTLEKMHARGWALNDTVQLGRDAEGKLWFQDLGQAKPGARPAQIEADLRHLDDLYREHGHSRLPTGEDLRRRIETARLLLEMAIKREPASDRAAAQFARWSELADARSSELSRAKDYDAWDAHEDDRSELVARYNAGRPQSMHKARRPVVRT